MSREMILLDLMEPNQLLITHTQNIHRLLGSMNEEIERTTLSVGVGGDLCVGGDFIALGRDAVNHRRTQEFKTELVKSLTGWCVKGKCCDMMSRDTIHKRSYHISQERNTASFQHA